MCDSTSLQYTTSCFFLEFGQSLKERSRECDKLSCTLERQQDSALRKLNEINETNAKERKNFQSTILRLEESEKELTINFENVEKVFYNFSGFF